MFFLWKSSHYGPKIKNKYLFFAFLDHSKHFWVCTIPLFTEILKKSSENIFISTSNPEASTVKMLIWIPIPNSPLLCCVFPTFLNWRETREVIQIIAICLLIFLHVYMHKATRTLLFPAQRLVMDRVPTRNWICVYVSGISWKLGF